MSVNIYDKTNDRLNLISGGTLFADAPIGAIIPYGGTTAPSGWLLCQGQAVSRTTYAELFKAIGTAFGEGDGSTTFNLPDYRGKVPFGADANNVIGTDENGALPNIKGGITGMRAGTGGTANGCVQTTGSAENVSTWSGSYGGWNIDASRSSTLYKDGQTTVVPANVRANYIIKAKHISVPVDFADSLVGYLGQETDYNLYPWSHVRTVNGEDTFENITIERDGWYSIDYTLSSNTDVNNSFTFRDTDSQGNVHTIMKSFYDKSGTFRQTFLVPLKAGNYIYSHGGIGTLSVYMNRRDFV